MVQRGRAAADQINVETHPCPALASPVQRCSQPLPAWILITSHGNVKAINTN